MKKIKQSSFIILMLFFVCSCTEKETVITGKIIGNADKLIYSNPNEGTCFAGFRDTINTDENGAFELKFKLKQASFICLWTSEKSKDLKLLLECGKNYHIIVDVENGVEISGDNQEGQQLYSSLPNPSFISMQNRSLQKEKSSMVIRDKILEMKNKELGQFQKLLNENKISKSFFDLIKIDRDCYYASLESRILQIKMYDFIPNEDEKYILNNGDNLLENLEQIYAQYPPDKNSFLISSFWPEYIKYFITDYKTLFQKEFDMEEFMELHQNGLLNTFFINESKKHLTGESLEFFQASYLFQESIQDKFEKELISLFKQFEKDYPNSEYSKYIKSHIDKIIDYYEKNEPDHEDDISFIEQFENKNSLKEIIEPLEGKMIYIDVWATWCGPCKKEFEHSKALKKILREKNTQMLYISIDTDEKDLQWREMIKHYNLEGKHLRANENLNQELRVLYDEKSVSISIPWYILIDEKGKILKKHAKRPSEIILNENLFE